jgi:hypothetical protein
MALVSKEVSAGEHQLERLRENLERWFDDAMDRFAGWYKRWTQQVSLIIRRHPRHRRQRRHDRAGESIGPGQRPTRFHRYRGRKRNPKDHGRSSQKRGGAAGARQQLLADSENLNLPLGWISPKGFAVGQTPQGFMGWLLKAAGLFLSVLAVSLGAPFWFDTLSKFMNVRAAGAVPSKTQSSPMRDTKKTSRGA